MAEYIEREALMRRIKEIHCAECNSYHGVRCRECWVDDTLDYIDCEPSADVAPVRHGRWEKAQDMRRMDGNIYDFRCSRCNAFAEKGLYNNYDRLTNYCPACGATMDLEEKNDTSDI